jgi:spore coat polysaccharide biosynthesis protein SpsF (cytidylyltransferase family)
MSILFRPHRGSLSEAMYEVREVSSWKELIDQETEVLSHWYIDAKPNEFHIEYYGEDERIGWSTYIITLDSYGVLGFTNGMLE